MSSDTPSVSENDTRKSVSDGAVTIVERVVSQAAQFVIFIMAARILGPAEFGVFALVSACAILALRAAEVGWAQYIMNWSGSDEVPRQVLLLSVLCGLLFMGIGLSAAGVLHLISFSTEIVTLFMVFSLWVWIATVSSAQKGMMIWLGRLKSSATCEMLGEAVGLAVAAAALLLDQGVLALAYGRVAFQSTHLLASFWVTRLWPQMGMTRSIFRDLSTFSAQFFVSRMLIHFRLYVATFIIGGFLGPAAVGYFRAADRLVSAVAELIYVPAQLLAWTNFKRARDAGPAEDAAARVNLAMGHWAKGIVLVGVPLFVWVMVMNDQIIEGLLTATWLPAAPLVALLAIGRLLLIFGPATEPIMSVMGQVGRLPLFMAFIFVVSVGVTLVSAQFGVVAVAAAQIIVGACGLVATLWLFRRYASISLRNMARSLKATALPIACGVLGLLVAEQALMASGVHMLVQAVLGGVFAVTVYLIAIYAFDRQTFDILKTMRPKRPAKA